MNCKIFLITLYIFLITTFALPQNQAGLPDLSFGNNGEVIHPHRPIETFNNFKDMALQPDGKIVVLAEVYYNNPPRWGFSLSRYNTNGSLDTTFGINGVSDGHLGGYVEVKSLAIQPGGKILVAGYGSFHFTGIGSEDFFISRFNADGSLDTSFGVNGKIITDFSDFEEISSDFLSKMAIQPDGKIIVVGYKRPFSYSPSSVMQAAIIARYNLDGTLDASFGVSGKAVITPSPETTYEHSGLLSVSFQSDGKILISGLDAKIGEAPYFEAFEEAFIGRLNTDGSIDRSYAADGFFRLEGDFFSQIKTLPNNKTLFSFEGRLKLFESDGSIDPNFLHRPPRINGYSPIIRAISFQTDGKLLVSAQTNPPLQKDLVISRHLPSGGLDHSFGKSGYIVKTSLEYLDGRKVFLQPDGKILVGGLISIQNRPHIYLARFLGDLPSGSEVKK